jgi:hypothetical protein
MKRCAMETITAQATGRRRMPDWTLGGHFWTMVDLMLGAGAAAALLLLLMVAP